MTETVVFPDIEALLVGALPALVGVSVVTSLPDPLPAAFVRVSRVGGIRRDLITDTPLVTFECWAEDRASAAALFETTRAAVFGLAQAEHGGDYVRRVSEPVIAGPGGTVGYSDAGPRFSPDPSSNTPRYLFTAQLETRGVAS